MKIGNRSSVLGTAVWRISDMSHVHEKKIATQDSQTQSTASRLTEAQRNQQLIEFKSQEQFLRANLHQSLRTRKLESNLNKRMSGEFPETPEANTARAEIIRAEMDRLKRIIDIASAGSSPGHGSVERDVNRQSLINRYQNEMQNLQTQYQKLQESQEMFEEQLTDIENGHFPKSHSEFGNTIVASPNEEGTPPGPKQSTETTEVVQQRATTLSLSINNPYSQGWRRPSSNATRHRGNSGDSGQVNQKGDGGNQTDYSAGSNSSNDSHASGTDNRSYTASTPKNEPSNSNEYENDTHDDANDIDIVSPAGYAPGEYQTLSGDDPMTGHGNHSGNDIGASGRIPKGLPDNRSGIQQMVQPVISLFSTTTGADDDEHPNTDNTQGTAWNPVDGNDLGDDLPYDLSGNGGTIDIEAGKVLLEQIRPMNPGGPDPKNVTNSKR